MWFLWLLWRCFFEELLILYSLKDIFEQVCYKCDKNYESDEGNTFFKDKKREVAYLQIRCILLILGSYKTFIEKKRPFLNKNTGICYDYQEFMFVRTRGSEDRPERPIPSSEPLSGSRISRTWSLNLKIQSQSFTGQSYIFLEFIIQIKSYFGTFFG